jgi:hypothetical protein
MQNKSDLFEIEKIMGKKVERNAIYFLVKWKGYPNKNNTWEPIENFMDLAFLLDKVEEFDHNTTRISNRHMKVVEYREKMSIEEESEEERDSTGRVRKFIKKSNKRKQNASRSKRKLKPKLSSLATTDLSETRYRTRGNENRMIDEDYVPDRMSEEEYQPHSKNKNKKVSKKKVNRSISRRKNQNDFIENDIEKMYSKSNIKKTGFGRSRRARKYGDQEKIFREEMKKFIESMERDQYLNDSDVLGKRGHHWKYKSRDLDFED